jgi:prepilin-type processing-associated H-X9-DG protein
METTNQNSKILKWKLLGIALLIGGLYLTFKPVYDRAWYSAHKATCLTNLKYIGIAMRLYARDSNDALPSVFSATDAVGWADTLAPYLEKIEDPYSGQRYDLRTFQCPFDATKQSDSPDAPSYTDYWYNANVMQKTPLGVSPVHLSSFKSPAQTILAGCGSTTSVGGFDATYNQCGDGTSLLHAQQTCKLKPRGVATLPEIPIHSRGERTNLLFADGHISSTSLHLLFNNGATIKSIGGGGTFSLLKR